MLAQPLASPRAKAALRAMSNIQPHSASRALVVAEAMTPPPLRPDFQGRALLGLSLTLALGAFVWFIPKSAASWSQEATIDFGESEVRVAGEVVFGGFAGFGKLNRCHKVPAEVLKMNPSFAVTGAKAKITVYARSNCEWHRQEVIGSCDANAAADIVEAMSGVNHEWLSQAQSFSIEQC